MTLLHIPVPDTAAQRFQSLSERQQDLVCKLVVDCITEPTKLAEAMDYLRFRAEKSNFRSDRLD